MRRVILETARRDVGASLSEFAVGERSAAGAPSDTPVKGHPGGPSGTARNFTNLGRAKWQHGRLPLYENRGLNLLLYACAIV